MSECQKETSERGCSGTLGVIDTWDSPGTTFGGAVALIYLIVGQPGELEHKWLPRKVVAWGVLLSCIASTILEWSSVLMIQAPCNG